GADATIDCPATPVFTAPTATDNCAPAPTVVEVSDVTNPGACAGTYTRTKTWKAVDACGNESGTVSQTITVHDVTKPSITCPANLTVQCASDVPAADISAVTASDSCGTVTVTHEGDVISGQTCPNKYTITRTYKATDACGNFETCTQTITVNDTTAPTISAAGADATIDCPATPVFTAPTATDNCAPAPTVVEVSDVTNPGACAGTYTRTKTWKAVDACGNESGTVSQTITVQDVTKPVITLNGSPAVTVECHTSYTDAGATASDTCAGTVLVTTSGSVNVNMVGTYTLTYGATDPCGNSANLVTRTVDVVDTTKPVITLNGAADVTLECHTSYTDAGATASDSCAGSLTATAVSTVDINTVGDYTVTFNVTDPSGNAADTVVRAVHVRDTIKPVISRNGSAVVTVECHTSYTDAGATASDTCAGAVPVTTSGSVNVNLPGSYTITYNATDPSGNHADTISRTVNVVDTTSPSIVCPPAQVAEATSPSGAQVNYPAPSVSDTCDANPTVVCTPPSGSTFPVGTTTVNCTATDASGNTAPCSFQVIVTSAQPPTLICPPDMQMACGQSTDPAHTGTASASATTCSGTVSISYSDAATPANCTGKAGIDRTWTAEDACGKKTNGVQHITFVDTTAPVLNGCTNQTVIAACNAPVNYVRPTATDTCSGTVTVTCSPESGTLMGPGAHTITVTATDACGNTTNRTFTVMVLSPLQVVFDSPLEDDNLANNTTPDGADATGTPEIVNQFTSGQTIPHKVKLLDCAGNDVTDSVAPLVKVTIDVTERTGGYYSSSILNNVPESYTGVGDPGSRLVLVDHHFQYNLKTTGYDAGTIKSNAKFFQSVVRVEYLANPGVTVGQENVILESK
ncbi:MAG TPA: immunoglobulin-like domain-containing protein, partial [Verrucomicrobiae bacterium]|nr:immunoglobulin-like domain-containing protein [Verrucomicrobiae bacterium]